jgi:hypothetical protein
MKISFARHMICIGAIIFLMASAHECRSQSPFLIGGYGKWVKKGSPFAFNGAKISFYDDICINAYVYGLNFSFVYSKIRSIHGFSFAPYSLSDGIYGLQIALFSSTTTVKGLEISLVNKRAHFIRPSVKAGNYGVQFGLYNATFNNFGLQFGVINSSWAEQSGIAVGAVNTNSLFQIGLMNIKTEKNRGVQIGIINYRKGNKWYAKVLPLMNFRIEKNEMDSW